MKITILAAIVAVFVLLRFRRAGLLTWALAWWLGFFVAIRFGFTVPIPASVVMMYMAIATIAVLAYVTSSAERREQVSGPIVNLIVNEKHRLALAAVALVIPALAAAGVYVRLSQPTEAPFFARTVHPASPAEISFNDIRSISTAARTPTARSRRQTPRRLRRTSRPAGRSTTRTATSVTATTWRGRGCSFTGWTRSRRTSRIRERFPC